MKQQSGLSLIELLIAVTLAGILIVGMQGLVGLALNAESSARARNDSLQQGRFSMQLMVKSVRMTRQLIIPIAGNPVVNPASDVLAVTMDPELDRNKDGWADANNDKDYWDINGDGDHDDGEPEKVDEDPGIDTSNDSAPGIIGIDDDGDGNTDIDTDGIEAGDSGDDEGDGSVDEDWLDPVVYFLDVNSNLIQRVPNINPSDGTDFQENPIAENVSLFKVKRIPQKSGRAVLVEIELKIGGLDSFITAVGVGSGL